MLIKSLAILASTSFVPETHFPYRSANVILILQIGNWDWEDNWPRLHRRDPIKPQMHLFDWKLCGLGYHSMQPLSPQLSMFLTGESTRKWSPPTSSWILLHKALLPFYFRESLEKQGILRNILKSKIQENKSNWTKPSGKQVSRKPLHFNFFLLWY